MATAIAQNKDKDIRFQFFPKKKRRLVMVRWASKRNAQNEKRVLVKFTMPLTGEPMTGFPDFLQAPFQLMEKEGQSATQLELSTELESMTVQFFDTASSPGRAQVFVATTMRKLELVRVPEGESFLTALKFNVTIPRNMTVLKFLHNYEGMTLWADFDPQEIQMRIEDEDEEEDEAEDERQLPLGADDGMPRQSAEAGRAVSEITREDAQKMARKKGRTN